MYSKIPENIQDVRIVKAGQCDGSLLFSEDYVVKAEIFDATIATSPDTVVLPTNTSAERDLLGLFHSFTGPVSEVGIYFLQNALLRGRGFVFSGHRLLNQPDLVPQYVRDMIANGQRDDVYYNPQACLTHYSGTYVSLFSEGYPIYGHWLVDTLPKAWLYKKFFTQNEDHKFVFTQDVPEFGLKILRDIFQISSDRLVFYDFGGETPTFDRLIVPSLLHNSHLFHPQIMQYVTDTKAGLGISDAQGELKLYISRSKFNSKSQSYKRFIVNESAVVDALTACGFQTVFPEDLTWPEQIALFSRAKIVIGESGSGLHNTLFSPLGTSVLCIQPNNHVQATLAQVAQHKFYIMSADSIDTQNGQEMSVDIERLTSMVMAIVSASN